MVRASLGELVFVKLGGSLITDKLLPDMPRMAVIERLAAEIAAALAQRPELQLVLGHGSGSFGHIQAQRYGVHLGSLSDWMGYAQTGAAAQRLNRLVTDALLAAGVPAVSIQPSASVVCRGGEIVQMSLEPIRHLLAHGAVPLVYGDVAVDAGRGCAIVSTEQVLGYLARNLAPDRIVEVGELDGVYTADPRRDAQAKLLPIVTPQILAALGDDLGGSHAVDVTGGMRAKVSLLLQLVASAARPASAGHWRRARRVDDSAAGSAGSAGHPGDGLTAELDAWRRAARCKGYEPYDRCVVFCAGVWVGGLCARAGPFHRCPTDRRRRARVWLWVPAPPGAPVSLARD